MLGDDVAVERRADRVLFELVFDALDLLLLHGELCLPLLQGPLRVRPSAATPAQSCASTCALSACTAVGINLFDLLLRVDLLVRRLLVAVEPRYGEIARGLLCRPAGPLPGRFLPSRPRLASCKAASRFFRSASAPASSISSCVRQQLREIGLAFFNAVAKIDLEVHHAAIDRTAHLADSFRHHSADERVTAETSSRSTTLAVTTFAGGMPLGCALRSRAGKASPDKATRAH